MSTVQIVLMLLLFVGVLWVWGYCAWVMFTDFSDRGRPAFLLTFGCMLMWPAGILFWSWDKRRYPKPLKRS